jgi:2,3,4,5-tetrahydropyridine-2,6-dicarboxylate N-succinyltransferase
MSHAALETAIDAAWEARDGISPATKGEARDAIEATLTALDSGSLRVAEKRGQDWHVNQWAKKAVLLSFRLADMAEISGGNGGSNWWDKVPSKFDGWGENQWRNAGFRAVPGSIVRRSAFIGCNVVLMPSFVKRVHLSGGVGIGGVLEPMQAGPTIIEDDCFIGARSEVVEGCIIREGSVLGMGVFIGKSTKIVDRETGAVMYGEVPAGSVVVAGSMPSKGGINLYCAVIVKKVDAQTRSKTSINELLRD